MADYKSWLFVSDIDGTLIETSRKMPQRNIDAIKDFVNNGGNFSVCTGRNLQSLKPHYKKCSANAPAVFLNGAGIYDFKKSELVYYNPFTYEQEEFLIKLINKYHHFISFVIYEPEIIHIIGKINPLGIATFFADKLSHKFYSSADEVPRGKWGKVSVLCDSFHFKKFRAEFNSFNYNKMFSFFPDEPKSSVCISEIAPGGINKGSGVKELISLYDFNFEKTAAIGDGWNDVDLLKSVNHSACCGQSESKLSQYCEYVSCRCKEGSVAQFLRYIKNKYINI